MSALDYDEVACPRCGSLNRRFHLRIMNAKHASQCDRCGADLATGHMGVIAIAYRAFMLGATYFVCGLLGVFLVAVPGTLLAWIFAGPAYEGHREAIVTGLMAAGAIAGLAVAERNRQRGGLGPKRVAAGSAQAAVAPGAEPSPDVEIVDMSPDAQAIVKAKAARQWFMGFGYLGGVVIGAIVSKAFPEWRDSAVGVGMLAGLAGGWIAGRVKYPVTRR